MRVFSDHMMEVLMTRAFQEIENGSMGEGGRGVQKVAIIRGG